MFRSRSPLGIEAVERSSDRDHASMDIDQQSADLKVLFTTLLEETESRGGRELIAEVDALVAGVVEEFHHDELTAVRPEPVEPVLPFKPEPRPRPELPAPPQPEPETAVAARERVPPWRTSSPAPTASPGVPLRLVNQPARVALAPVAAPSTRNWLPIGLGAGLVASAAVIWLMVGGDPSATADVPVAAATLAAESAPPPAATAAPADSTPTPPAATLQSEPVRTPAASPAVPVPATTPAATQRGSTRSTADSGRPRSSTPSAAGPATSQIPQSAPTLSATTLLQNEASRAPFQVEPVIELRSTPPTDHVTSPVGSEPPPSAPRTVATPTVTAPPAETAAGVTTAASGAAGAPAVPTGTREPRLVKRVMPVYPPQLLAARIGGIIRIGLTVDAQGRVASVQPTGGHELLRREAVAAVGQWQYEPAMEAGVPSESHIVVYLTFDPQVRRQQ